MKPKYFHTVLLLIAGSLVMFSLQDDIDAQKRPTRESPGKESERKESERRESQRRERPERHRTAHSHLPRNAVHMEVHKHPYYYHHGVFYRHGPHGYGIARAPLGARIRVLPFGYINLNIGGVPYFYYYGTYYRYLPDEQVYVVVQNPEAGAQEENGIDTVYLVDGSTLEGIYMGGTEDTVQFETNGMVQDIAVTDIVSITFAPPEDDGDYE